MLTKDPKIPARVVLLFFADLIILASAPVAAALIYLSIRLGLAFKLSHIGVDISYFLLHISVFMFSLYLFDQYNYQQDFRRKQQVVNLMGAVVAGGVFTTFLSFILAVPSQGRGAFIIYCALLFGFFLAIRILYSFIGSVGVYDKKAYIVGNTESGRNICRIIRNNRQFGIRIHGVLSDEADPGERMVEGVPVFRREKSYREFVAERRPHLLIMAKPREEYLSQIKDLTWCAQQGVKIWDVISAYEYLERRIPLEYVDQWWLFIAAMTRPSNLVIRAKRVLDIAAALVGLSLGAPFMILTALAIRLESRGPVLLRQQRTGKQGRLIYIYKFRSMNQVKPQVGEKGTNIGDKRVTRVGRVIRKLHLDELPQFFNILKGDISLVGPRSELYEFIQDYVGEFYEENGSRPEADFQADCGPGVQKVLSGADSEKRRYVPFLEQRFTVDQGLTGWAQIMAPYVSSTYDDMVKKLEYDLYYIRNMSLLMDLIIIMKTIRVVLLGKGK